MACGSQTLENLIQSNGYAKLSDRYVLICMACVLGTSAGFSNASSAIERVYTNKLSKLSDRELLMCLASIFGSGNAQIDVSTATSNGMEKVASDDLPRMLLASTC